MDTLIAVALANESEGSKVLGQLLEMQKKRKIKMKDVCVVRRHEGGSVEVKQLMESVEGAIYYGMLLGGLAGLLSGLVFIGPIAGIGLGILLGGLLGSIYGYLDDYGINNDFIRETATLLEPESSAVFLLSDRRHTDRILSLLANYSGEVLHTDYSEGKEQDLFKKLQKARKEDKFREIMDVNETGAYGRKKGNEV